MPCELTIGCNRPVEGSTNGCATCRREQRKAIDQAAKPKKVYTLARQKTPIKKVGTTNTFLCSDGSRVTQAQIERYKTEAYKTKYPSQTMMCHGCGLNHAHGSAHIIPQARCKQLGLTDLIWNTINFFPGCIICNSVLENPKGSAWKKLLNIEYCLAVIKQFDEVLYQKFINN